MLRKKQLLRQQLEVPGAMTVSEAISAMTTHKVAAFIVVDAKAQVIGLFTARDLFSVLAAYPNKADGLSKRVEEFMVPLSQLVTCAPDDR